MPNPRLSFRCTPRHADAARNRAAREGVSLSVALRALLLDYIAGRHPSVLIARTLEQIRDELHAIGVNLNQAARALNTGLYPADLEPIVRRLAAAVHQMRAQLEAYPTT